MLSGAEFPSGDLAEGAHPALIGLTMHHAYVLAAPAVDFVSNAVVEAFMP